MSEIRHMKMHQSGYVVPWAIQMVNGKPTVCLNYDIGVAPAGTRTVRLTLTDAGYVAEGWTPAEEKPSNAAISIVTRKYPWMGATDDDVATVIIS